MCVRFCPLTEDEAQAVLDARGTGRHGIRFIEHPDPIRDARPGSTVPLFVPDGAGGLRVATLVWGVPLDGKPRAVFNTRIESALEQLRRGRRSMWAKASSKAAALYRYGTSMSPTSRRGSSADASVDPSSASTASASPEPVRSCSPPSRSSAASPSSPSRPTPALRPSTTACSSSSDLASQARG